MTLDKEYTSVCFFFEFEMWREMKVWVCNWKVKLVGGRETWVLKKLIIHKWKKKMIKKPEPIVVGKTA